jgi:hypothetical protein
VRVVGHQRTIVKMVGGEAVEASNVTLESDYDDTYVVMSVVLRRVDEADRRIFGLHAQVLPASIEALNDFSLWDMGFAQYGVLFGMVAVAITTVSALREWFRRRRALSRRWWWLLAILVGAFKIAVNWKTGAVVVEVLQIQLFSLSATRTPVSPWILSFSIPAGAIAFLINARRGRRTVASEPDRVTVPPSGGSVGTL